MNDIGVRELGLFSLLYVSRSSLEGSQEEAQVGEIIRIAVARNAELRVTGSLLFTGAHFAQVLEGPREAVADLMSSIEADSRHRDVTTVKTRTIGQRMFPDWAMAYSGRSPFLDRHLKPLLSPLLEQDARNELVDEVLQLMIKMTGSSHRAERA
jgi:hypothetical protein